MTLADIHVRKLGLEVATYANSLRVVLRRCGIFQNGDRAVGLILPPDAAIDKYRDAVRLLLTRAGIFHYAVPIVRVSPLKEIKPDASHALKTLSSGMAVIVLVENGADLPPEVTVSLDRVVKVGNLKPYHLRSAARALMGLSITGEQGTALIEFRPSLLFAEIRISRPVEVTLEKLGATIVQGKSGVS